jgi:hypothetical protein
MRKLLPALLSAAALTAAMISLVALATPAGASPRHTARIVVRPVHADGRPVAGYRVSSESISGFSCTDVSPVAVDRNIRFCGFSATYTMACWKSAHHTVLCLRDPWAKRLVRIRYTGSFRPVAAPRHPAPEGLTLGDGNRCWIRDGGAWSPVLGHPNWYGGYGCELGDVYGPGTHYGVSTRTDPWRVHLVVDAGTSHQQITDHRVAKAYFVGTAA